MWEDFVLGLIPGILLGAVGSIYLIFRKGYIQAMIFTGVRDYSDQLIKEVTEKPEILRPYMELLVRQVQDPEMARAIVAPFMKEVFKHLPVSPGEDGQIGIDFKGVPKEYRWLVQLGLQIFGPGLLRGLGAGTTQANAATDLLGLPLKG